MPHYVVKHYWMGRRILGATAAQTPWHGTIVLINGDFASPRLLMPKSCRTGLPCEAREYKGRTPAPSLVTCGSVVALLLLDAAPIWR
jgi:hypothetical protein